MKLIEIVEPKISILVASLEAAVDKAEEGVVGFDKYSNSSVGT